MSILVGIGVKVGLKYVHIAFCILTNLLLFIFSGKKKDRNKFIPCGTKRIVVS